MTAQLAAAVRVAVGIYAAILRVYPADFRADQDPVRSLWRRTGRHRVESGDAGLLRRDAAAPGRGDRKVPQFNSSIRYVYKLDGSKSVNHNGAVTLTSTSRWDGATLVTEGFAFQVTNQGEDSWTQREVLYLERGELVHELTSMRGGKVGVSSRRIYRRAAAAR